MDLSYFLSGNRWLDMAATWVLLLPLLSFGFTGNLRKSYGLSIVLSLLCLFVLALRDNGYLTSGSQDFDLALGNAMLTLHTITASFFMVHFTDLSRKKDQRLVLYILMAGFIILFVLVGLKTVVFFIVNMGCSIVLVLYSISAVRNLLDQLRQGTRAVAGRLLMVLSILGARVGLLLLYGVAFAMSPNFEVFTLGFECLTLLSAITLFFGLLRDSGYDPENEEDDDGPYEALRIDPD